MHSTSLIGKETVADGTMVFRFTKPEGFVFQAGQSIDMKLIDPPETDTEGNMRSFSLSSTPHDPYLEVVTRMRDTAFKRVLRDMKEGTSVSIQGPFGSFALHESSKRPAVFIAGGIGITPLYSMLCHASECALPHAISLLYANRRPEEATFLSELQEHMKTHPNHTLTATMTKMAQSSATWSGVQGRIDSAMVQEYVSAHTLPLFYIAGPPMMVLAMRTLLNEMGVSNDDIRFEDFAGY